MRDMNLKNNFKRAAGLGLIAAGALMASQAAMACQLSAWTDSFGAPIADDPAAGPGNPAVARYSGFCGMQAEDGVLSGVRDDSPGGIDRIRARFYVKLDNSATAQIYQARASGGSEVFRIEADASGVISLIGADSAVSAAGGDGLWTSVEVDWDPAGGGATLTVGSLGTENTDNASISGASPIVDVRLGNLNSAGGTLTFDAYESRRTEAIGRLCRGDADNSGDRSLVDLQTIFTEIQSLGNTPSPGQPDADENGLVALPDMQTIFNQIQALQLDCATFPG